jgi:hypothetical protein
MLDLSQHRTQPLGRPRNDLARGGRHLAPLFLSAPHILSRAGDELVRATDHGFPLPIIRGDAWPTKRYDGNASKRQG